MSEINCRIGSENAIRVPSSFSGSRVLSGLNDVDITGGLSNGMVLVYNTATSKWEATLNLTPGGIQNLDIDGGNF
jgi:hypothetical protein